MDWLKPVRPATLQPLELLGSGVVSHLTLQSVLVGTLKDKVGIALLKFFKPSWKVPLDFIRRDLLKKSCHYCNSMFTWFLFWWQFCKTMFISALLFPLFWYYRYAILFWSTSFLQLRLYGLILSLVFLFLSFIFFDGQGQGCSHVLKN